MKKFFIPFLTFIALSNVVKAEIDPNVHNICKDVKDYKGCVELRGKKISEIETRQLVRKDGTLSLFNPSALIAKKVRGEYGRYITFRYFRDKGQRKYEMSVEADCKEYTANWLDDGKGWLDLKNPKWLKKEPPQEAKNILDEFCPKMDKLVEEAKSGSRKYFEYPPSTVIVRSSGGGSVGGGGISIPAYQPIQQPTSTYRSNVPPLTTPWTRGY